mgnify:CR=1 FL=1
MNSLVSIITPSYNSAKFIRQCIKSVIAQTYTNWEMLIIDDYSIDNSREIITSLAEKNKKIDYMETSILNSLFVKGEMVDGADEILSEGALNFIQDLEENSVLPIQ